MILSPTVSAKISKMSLLCAFFVVCIHFPPLGGRIGDGGWWVRHLFHQGICRIAVPFFFIVSGYLLAQHCNETNWWKAALAKRLRTIVLPFFIWSLLYAIYASLRILLANILEGNPLTTELPITGRDLLWILGLLPDKHPFLTPLWFLQGLFIFVVIAPVLVRMIQKGKTIRTLVLLILALVFFFNPLYAQNKILLFTFTHVIWFAVGLHLAVYPIDTRSRQGLSPACGCLGGICLILSSLSDLYGWPCGGGLSELHIPFTLYFFWSKLSGNPWQPSLVQTTFPIFLMHMFFLSFLRAVYIRLPFAESIPVFASFLACGLTFIASIRTAQALHRYLPRTAAVLFGGRGSAPTPEAKASPHRPQSA